METVRDMMRPYETIQNTVEEYMSRMPTEAARSIMEACQEAHRTTPTLWCVIYILVEWTESGGFESYERSVIVEEDPSERARSWSFVLDMGVIPTVDQHSIISGVHARDGENRLRIVTKVEPFKPMRKRVRE